MPFTEAHVKVRIQDVKDHDEIPQRSVMLKAPDWSIKIGRGTHNGEGELEPTENNMWFDSRVMSRNHALLTADPHTKELFIQDAGSMHGTQLAGRRIKTNVKELLYEEDIIIFGADVTRADSFFPALEVMVGFNWVKARAMPLLEPIPHKSRNSFTADYSDEEDQIDDPYSDETDESVHEPSVEVIIPAHTFAVPESDNSDSRSYSSEEIEHDPESPSSSPIRLPEMEKHEDVIVVSSGPARMTPSAPATSSPSNRRNSAPTSDSGYQEHRTIENYDYYESDYEDSDVFENDDTVPEVEVKMAPKTSSALGKQVAHPSPGQKQPDNEQPRPIRAPSPSDAAMAKLPTSPPRSPPFIRRDSNIPDAGDSSHPMSDFTSDSYSRTGNGWAGHNSVLYDPMSVGEYPFNPLSFGLPDQTSWDGVPMQGMMDDATGPVFDFSNNFPPSEISFQPEQLSFIGAHETTEPKPAKQSADKMDHFAKFSSTSKRKADQITQGKAATDLEMRQETIQFVAPRLILGRGTEDLLNGMTTATTVSTAPEIVAVKETLEAAGSASSSEPARKKLKTTDSVSGQISRLKFVKFAATALAGAAIGAAGMVFGLAALPQDYFV